MVQPKPNYLQTPSMELTFDQASYLRERVMTSCSDTLLAHLLQHQVDVKDAALAWELPIQLPEPLEQLLVHARNFSETIHGAQLLYNLILAEQTENQFRIEEYRKGLDEWWRRIEARRDELMGWSHVKFWLTVLEVNPRVSIKAKSFIQSWFDLALGAAQPHDVIESAQARTLIELREFQIKGSLARTRSQRARELWSGAAGSEQLDLRWRVSRRLIADILQGLEVTANAQAT